MKTTLTLCVRAFPITVHDHSTGQEREDVIVLDKSALKAAQIVGQSSKELITRLCERAGLSVLSVGKAERREIELNLEGLYGLHSVYQIGKEISASGEYKGASPELVQNETRAQTVD